MIVNDDKKDDTPRDQQTRSTRCQISMKDVINIVSSLLVPIVLGVFTVLSAYNQHYEMIRQKDRDEALQKQQWVIENNRSEQQRKIEMERNDLQQRIEYERNEQMVQMDLDRYRNSILMSYIKDIGEMLVENNYSLTHDRRLTALARSKTLNTISQLDTTRIEQILRFLYEASILTSTDDNEPLDISTAHFNFINKKVLKTQKYVGILSLRGAIFENCSFDFVPINDIDFSSAQMSNINFDASSLNRIQFSSAVLSQIRARSTHMKDIDFSHCVLENAEFSSTTLENIRAISVRAKDVYFLSGEINHSNISGSSFDNVGFALTSLTKFHGLSLYLRDVNFISSQINDANFSSSIFDHVNLTSSTLEHIDAQSIFINDANFSSAKMKHVNFSDTRMIRVDFWSAKMNYFYGLKMSFNHVNFSLAQFNYLFLSNSRLSHVHSSFVQGTHIDIYGIDLSYSQFVHASLKHLNGPFMIVTHTDFSLTQWIHANISNCQMTHVDFSSGSMTLTDMTGIHLEHVNFSSMIMEHIQGVNMNLRNVDFASSQWHNVDFSNSEFEHVNFFSAEFENIHAVSINVKLSKMDSVKFINGTFSSVNSDCSQRIFSKKNRLNRLLAEFSNLDSQFDLNNNSDHQITKMLHNHFRMAQLKQNQFGCVQFQYVKFEDTELSNVNFSFAELTSVDFSSSQLVDVDFSHALLRHVTFSSSIMINVDFSAAILHNVSFLQNNASNVSFQFSIMCKFIDTSDDFLILPNYSVVFFLAHIDFISNELNFVSFYSVRRLVALFNDNEFNFVDFKFANAKYSHFSFNKWNNTNIYGANFQWTDFSKSNITSIELNTAISIQGTRLSSNEISSDSNLIRDFPGSCFSSISNSWNYEIGNNESIILQKSGNFCLFALNMSLREAVLLQKISIQNIWNSTLWPFSFVVLRGKMGEHVSIQLLGVTTNGTILSSITMDSTVMSNQRMKLHETTGELVIKIHFFRHSSTWYLNDAWCEYLSIFIDYGTEFDSRQRVPHIPENTVWSKQGITVVNGISSACGVAVDQDNGAIFTCNRDTSGVMASMPGESRHVRVGKFQQGYLTNPPNIFIDKETNSMISCDLSEKSLKRWYFRSNITRNESIISGIECNGFAVDDEGIFYVVDNLEHSIKRYSQQDRNGDKMTISLDRFTDGQFIFVDGDGTVYVSDRSNSRVVKWVKGAKEAIVVAGFGGRGSNITQLDTPNGIVVDGRGTIYIADKGNHCLIRWRKGEKHGEILAGGKKWGSGPSDLSEPTGLAFDRYNNLYVADHGNRRVQRFSVE